jgi:hypothetical protein
MKSPSANAASFRGPALVALLTVVLLPALATANPDSRPSSTARPRQLEAKLDQNARVGSEEEQRLRTERAAEKARLLAAQQKETKTKSAKPGLRDEVIIIGSSSVKGALGGRLTAGLQRDGFRASRWGRSASGLSRLDYYDWFDAITDLSIGKKSAGVIVYVGVNDPQGIWLYPHERPTRDKWVRWHQKNWSDVYRERVTMLIDALCALGAPKVIVLTPVDVRWPSLQERLIRIRRLQIEGAQASTCGEVVSGSGDSIYLGTPDEARQSRRARDGYHLTSVGGDIVWERIKYRVLRIFRGKPWADIPATPDVRSLSPQAQGVQQPRRQSASAPAADRRAVAAR